ncbi:hypothetical protein HDV64DRAFT_256188 [Trichoderma sp. TUCIM 5745]
MLCQKGETGLGGKQVYARIAIQCVVFVVKFFTLGCASDVDINGLLVCHFTPIVLFLRFALRNE